MKLFLAGGEFLLNGPHIDLLRNVPYLLMSYFALSNPTKPKAALLLKQAKISILDSGAFSFLYGGQTVDYSKYIEGYCRFVHDYRIQNYVELDLDGVWPLDKIEQTRMAMARAVGWSPMPCWHVCRGLENLKELSAKHEYLAIGSEHGLGQSKTVMLYKTLGAYVGRLPRKPKIHLMGIMTPAVFNLGFFSCDASSSLVFGNSKGRVNLFEGGTFKTVTLLLREANSVTYLCVKNHLKAVEWYENYGGDEKDV